MRCKDISMTIRELIEATAQEMYRELAMMFHPDRGGDPEKMKILNKARDEGDWDKVKRMYRTNVEIEKEDDEKEIPQKGSLLRKLYQDWAYQIQQDLAERGNPNIHILIELQGTGANAWVQWLLNGQRRQVYIPKIERFKRKKDFSEAILKKFMENNK
jgi:hypothetical protein